MLLVRLKKVPALRSSNRVDSWLKQSGDKQSGNHLGCTSVWWCFAAYARLLRISLAPGVEVDHIVVTSKVWRTHPRRWVSPNYAKLIWRPRQILLCATKAVTGDKWRNGWILYRWPVQSWRSFRSAPAGTKLWQYATASTHYIHSPRGQASLGCIAIVVLPNRPTDPEAGAFQVCVSETWTGPRKRGHPSNSIPAAIRM